MISYFEMYGMQLFTVEMQQSSAIAIASTIAQPWYGLHVCLYVCVSVCVCVCVYVRVRAVNRNWITGKLTSFLQNSS